MTSHCYLKETCTRERRTPCSCAHNLASDMDKHGIAQYLAEAWSMRNRCKHNSDRTAGVVVVDAAPETGRGADGRDAMADG